MLQQTTPVEVASWIGNLGNPRTPTRTYTSYLGSNQMISEPDLLQKLRIINQSAAFNRWAGFEVSRVAIGEADLTMERRPEHGQYSDLLHVGLVAALIDTCCGFAAVTLFDRVLASHFAVDCLRPAQGQSFLAKGRVLKSGSKQIFATAELHAFDNGTSKLVATGNVIMVPIGVAKPETGNAPGTA